MKLNSWGKAVEADIIEALRRDHACRVFTSRNLDVRHKIDGEIRRIGKKNLRKNVQLQLTLRVDHFGKLEAYLASRWLNTNIVSLYVEIHRGPGIAEIAEHLVWAAEASQQMPPYRSERPIFGLRIDDDAAFFDPYERLRELKRERRSPERLAALKTGTVWKSDATGLWIKDESRRTFFAHYIDVFDESFRHRLQNGEVRLPVKFYPIGSRATDIQPVR